MAGIGGIFKDYRGRFILAFGKKLIHWDIAQLEMKATFTVKDYVKDWMLDFKGVIVESDNINAITYLQNSLKSNKCNLDNNSFKDSFFFNDFNKLVFYTNSSFHVLHSTHLHPEYDEVEGAEEEATSAPALIY
ncbi:hypothetical protein MA16_Dca008405 [Dendrobium catenatum]|uniref:RNase H type-1 domain-containing protein n=1 Tax=Dendrobium catenatum TaxID=906689 RepID=A0A2I0VM39_9ASPA|nr:hypothetical protein MA16_Dca008405 [Dendrobium catenatum]